MKHAFIIVAAAGVLPGALAACKCPSAGDALPCARLGNATAVVKASITGKVAQGTNQQFTLKVRLPLKGSFAVGSTINATTPKETFSCNVTNLLVGQTALFTLNGAAGAYTFDDCGINQPWGSVADTLRRSLTRIGSQATDCSKGGKPCTFNGQTVPDGWRGNNTGADSCNICDCKNGFLRCEEKGCDGSEPPPLTPAILGEILLRNILKNPATKLVQESAPLNKTADSESKKLQSKVKETINATIEDIKNALGVGTDNAVNQTDLQKIVDTVEEAAPLPEIDSPDVQINVSTELPPLPQIAELIPPETVKQVAQEIQSVLAPVEPPTIAPIPTQNTFELAVPQVQQIDVPKLVEVAPAPTISLAPLVAPTATATAAGPAASQPPGTILPPPPLAPPLSPPIDLNKDIDAVVESAAPSSVLVVPEPTTVDEKLDTVNEVIQNAIDSVTDVTENSLSIDVPALTVVDPNVPDAINVSTSGLVASLPAPEIEKTSVEAPDLTLSQDDASKVGILDKEASSLINHIQAVAATEQKEAISNLVESASAAVQEVSSVGALDVPSLLAEPTAVPSLIAPTPVVIQVADLAAPVPASVDLAVPTNFQQVLIAKESEAIAALAEQQKIAQQQELNSTLSTLDQSIKDAQDGALLVEKVTSALDVPTLAPEPTAAPAPSLAVPTAALSLAPPQFTDAPLAVEDISLPSPLIAAINSQVQQAGQVEVGAAAAAAQVALASATVEAPQIASDQPIPSLAVSIQPLAAPAPTATAGVVAPDLSASPLPKL